MHSYIPCFDFFLDSWNESSTVQSESALIRRSFTTLLHLPVKNLELETRSGRIDNENGMKSQPLSRIRKSRASPTQSPSRLLPLWPLCGVFYLKSGTHFGAQKRNLWYVTLHKWALPKNGSRLPRWIASKERSQCANNKTDMGNTVIALLSKLRAMSENVMENTRDAEMLGWVRIFASIPRSCNKLCCRTALPRRPPTV